MTDDELARIKKESADRVRVGCDEYHVHTARDDCLVGDPLDITILKLAESLTRERRVVSEAMKDLKRIWDEKRQCTEPECALAAKVDKPHCWRHDPTPTVCQSGRDGECYWAHCPQLRDGEPKATGRHCPIDFEREG